MNLPADPDAYYFGCHRDLGHFLWLPGMQRQRGDWLELMRNIALWFGVRNIDGGLCPGYDPRGYGHNEYAQGYAKLTYAAPWTALAFWDRTIDHRPGSNSTFILRGNYSFDEEVAAAKAYFPEVWARYTFAVCPAG